MKKSLLLITTVLTGFLVNAQVLKPNIAKKKTAVGQANYVPKQKTLGTERSGTAIWGVGSTNGVADAEFANNFVQATTFAPGDNPTSWTARSVHDNSATNVPGSAYWTRSVLGYSQGAYWFGTTPLSSPSSANGVAIFDSDFMDNNGVQGDFGLGISPTVHRGELISPRMDLSGYTDSAIAVCFYGLYREFQIVELSVSISLDDGATWVPSVDYRSLLPQLTEGTANVIFPTALNGVTNLTQCRIKFTFDGDYYFMVLDDVSVKTAPDHDLSLGGIPNITGNTLFETGHSVQVTGNRHFPVDYLHTNWHGYFGANVSNKGAYDILPTDNPRLVADIAYNDMGTWTTVYRDTILLDTIPFVGYTTAFDTLSDFSWAQAGDYRLRYIAHADINDPNGSDDTLQQFFTLTDNDYVSKVDTSTNGYPFANGAIFPGGGPYSAYEYGSVFYFDQPGNTLSLDSLSVTLRLSSSFFGAASQTLFVKVYEVTDLTTSVINDGAYLTEIGQGTINLTGLGTTFPAGDFVFARATNFVDTAGGAMPDLEGGKHYYVSIVINPSLTGGPATFDTDDVPWIGRQEDAKYNMNNGFSNTGQIINTCPLNLIDASGISTWYWTGFGAQYIPSIGLHITEQCSGGPVTNYTSSSNDLMVDFTNSTTSTTGTSTYLWDFGDGNTSTMEDPSYTYAAAGTYTVCLTVTDDCGTDSTCMAVTVTDTSANNIEEVILQNAKVYPNPANELMTVNVSSNEQIDLTILDMMGQVITRLSFSHSTVIKTGHLADGVYFLQLKLNGARINKRIVVTH